MTRSSVQACSTLLVLSGLVALQGDLPIKAATTAPFSDVVTFGTSLSDSGNAFVLIDENGTPPDYNVDGLLQPFSPYARGGNHLTNDVRDALVAFPQNPQLAGVIVQSGVAPFACHKPSEFVFWDGIHPTTAVHGILAREAASALGIQ